ncbi:MAG: hypothetical protein KIS78_31585 [Labilithrix sp.]|nr:hypothetical protein [Labilithrix sp.]MCW5836979.1 hypothetical protein [Labilithrix sp.]
MEGDEEPRESDRRAPGAEEAPPDGAGATTRTSGLPSLPAAGTGKNHRILFALLWLAVQATLIVTAGRRSDGAFGFRMFNESSTIKLALYRELERDPGGPRARVPVEGGVWIARASDGTNHRMSWYDRVPTPFWAFDQEMPASYGAAAQLERLQRALDDLATHVSAADDLETRRFVLDVTVRRNGREPVVHQLTSREREAWTPRRADGAP